MASGYEIHFGTVQMIRKYLKQDTSAKQIAQAPLLMRQRSLCLFGFLLVLNIV